MQLTFKFRSAFIISHFAIISYQSPVCRLRVPETYDIRLDLLYPCTFTGSFSTFSVMYRVSIAKSASTGRQHKFCARFAPSSADSIRTFWLTPTDTIVPRITAFIRANIIRDGVHGSVLVHHGIATKISQMGTLRWLCCLKSAKYVECLSIPHSIRKATSTSLWHAAA